MTNDRYSEFDALVTRHRRMIRAICLWHATGGAVECDDLVQEVLASLWRSRGRLRPGCSAGEEKAWVRLHCRSVVSHFYRKKRIATVSLEEGSLMTDELSETADRRETIEMLASDLTAHEREILQMTLEGYEADEIAERTGIKPRSVVQTRWRIVQKMKQKADTI